LPPRPPVCRPQEYQSRALPTTRIQPDRRWFGNTRVIGQKQLEQFRTEMSSKVNDAYTVLLREKKLPLQLLEDPDKKRGGKEERAKVLNSFSFGDTFGPNRKRKRPKLAADSLDELADHADKKEETFDARPDRPTGYELKDMDKDAVFVKGQSRRIWGELYKVLDSSDVVIQVRGAPSEPRAAIGDAHMCAPPVRPGTCTAAAPGLLGPNASMHPAPAGAGRQGPDGHPLQVPGAPHPHQRAPQAHALPPQQVRPGG
jgi:hypothetical protein